MQFWKSWGLKDSDIKGLRSVPFSLEVHVCMQTGVDDTSLRSCWHVVLSVWTLGSRLARGLLGHKTYILFLVSYLCSIPKRKTFFFLVIKALKTFCKSIFSVSKFPKERFEAETQMRFVREDEFSPSVQMRNAKTFLSSAGIKIAPHHVD